MGFYIGFDIGGTKCAVCIAQWENQEIKIIDRQEVPTKDSPLDTIDALAPYVHDWIAQYAVAEAGISCGGPLDSKKGVIISTPNLAKGWHGFEIVSYVKTRFGLSAKLENDANACALAEWTFGAGRGTKNMIFMTFGTGLGAGLILDGKLYSGTNGNAGEVGHIRLADHGPIGFYKAGSAEGFCSGNGIRNLALLRAQEQNIQIEESITAKTIFERAYLGESFYEKIVAESAEKFGFVISILLDLFNPEVIVAGGVFMRNYELFMKYLRPVVEKESLAESYSVCKIVPAEIGENVGDYAALALAVSEEKHP